MPVSQRLPVLVLVCSSVIWGATWIPLKYFAAQGLDGAALLLLAYGSVAVLAVPVLWRRFLWKQGRRWRAEWRFMLGIFLLGGYANVAFNTSVMYGDVVRAMSLFYTLPVWAVLGGIVFLGERLTPARALSVLLALAGAWLILGGTDILAQPPSWLDALAMSSGFAYAMNNIIFRATPAAPIQPKIALMFFSGAVFSGLVLVVSALFGGQQQWPSQAAPSLLLLACAFGVGWMLLANIGTQWAVTHLEAGRAAVIIILELVTTIITAMWINDDQLSLLEWCGAGLILSAAVLEARG